MQQIQPSDLGELDAASLNEAVRDPAFWKSFRALSSARKAGVLELLCRRRIGDLTVAGRAGLIAGLQRGPTPKQSEVAIRDVFLATYGDELTRLKRRVDGQGDYHDLVQLIYHDVDAKDLRQQILDHFAEQAQACPCSELRVLSDVDDTFYRNWADPRYPTGTVYPGVLQLFHEIDFPESDSDPGDIVFLTGRVGERSGFLENRYRRQFSELGAENFTVLTGSLVHQFVWPWILHRKWYNFERHRVVFPEMGVVMFGDTGQADPEFLVRARQRYPGDVRAALLHRVKPIAPERRQACEEAGVLFYETYVGAALHLHRLGLIERPSLERVASAARDCFARIKFPSEVQRAAREAEIERDCALAAGA